MPFKEQINLKKYRSAFTIITINHKTRDEKRKNLQKDLLSCVLKAKIYDLAQPFFLNCLVSEAIYHIGNIK